jgi:hypothetical protein
MINAFIYGMICEVLVHALSRETPCMMWEILDITSQLQRQGQSHRTP